MIARALYSAVVASLALPACAAMHASPGAGRPCNQQVCFAVVSVDNCTISVAPDTLPIARNNANVQIHWDIDNASAQAGYTFAANGITINNNPPQFHDPQRLTPRKFKWKDNNTDNVKYKYAVNIEKGTTACPPKDPFIHNGQ
jgi:hypothetical protein